MTRAALVGAAILGAGVILGTAISLLGAGVLTVPEAGAAIGAAGVLLVLIGRRIRAE